MKFSITARTMYLIEEKSTLSFIVNSIFYRVSSNNKMLSIHNKYELRSLQPELAHSNRSSRNTSVN